jgi:hypothetical protein
MLRQFGKTLGGAIAVLCLVSTLAVADEMTCTASDGKGNCTAATGPDGKVVVVVGEGVKVGEKMDCQHKGSTIDCKPLEPARASGHALRVGGCRAPIRIVAGPAEVTKSCDSRSVWNHAPQRPVAVLAYPRVGGGVPGVQTSVASSKIRGWVQQ